MPGEPNARSDHYESILKEAVGKGENLEVAIKDAVSQLEWFRRQERYDSFLTDSIYLSKDGATYSLFYRARFTRYTITREEPIKVETTFPSIVKRK